jgi:subtilisin family serine protease
MHARRHSLGALVAAAVVAAALVWAVSASRGASGADLQPASWKGLVGDARSTVSTGERMIVLLRTPSVGSHLAQAHYATESQERAWAAQALAAQREVLTTLATEGVSVHPDFNYVRVVDGFAAALDPRAVALLRTDPEVTGVFPVRAAFPASVSAQLLAANDFGPQSGRRPEPGLPGYDGRGITIALLDTGVDQAQPYLRGRVVPGVDVLDGGETTGPKHDPQDPSRIEQHGTELAGILVGADGPGGLHGVAPAASVLSIRVAGWQRDALGRDVVYARSDQLIAGLDRAVDPNGDGDTHDAARVALIGVAEPYGAFADGPEAQAVQGALDLGTVVVAPAGNDGAAGPSFGSISGPAGASAALAVGATDSRTRLPVARVVLRRGLDVLFDQRLPLLGPVERGSTLTLPVAAPRVTTGVPGASGADFFDQAGNSLVADKAAVVPVGSDAQATAVAAARAGAAAVVLYGDALPPGALRVSEDLSVPVVAVPTAAALELLAAQRAGVDVGIAIGAPSAAANPDLGFVAGFSSHGLAFDGRVKPDLAAPGVGLATSEPGAATDGSALYGTVNGTSGAAAIVAGAAAVLAQVRPGLDGADLKSLLVGYSAPGGAPMAQVGAGALRLGASAVGEVASEPTTLGFGIWEGPRWHATRTIVVRNVSTRRLQLSLQVLANGESEALHFAVAPSRLVLRAGRAHTVTVTVTAPAAPAAAVVTGVVEVSPAGGIPLRVPWALVFAHPSGSLLAHVSLSQTSFKRSDTNPPVLTVQAGNVVSASGIQIEPVSRLDVLLYRADGSFVGVLARLRDLLPGSYSFGVTGRGPTSEPLPPGRYELRLAAWPTLPAQAAPSRAQVGFRIE